MAVDVDRVSNASVRFGGSLLDAGAQPIEDEHDDEDQYDSLASDFLLNALTTAKVRLKPDRLLS